VVPASTHCLRLWAGTFRFSKLIVISHSPGLRAGSSVADAGKAAIRPTTGIKASHRMILLRERDAGGKMV
jgi:hypothetical protein